MEKEIKINNSKLKIVKLDYDPSKTNLTVKNKSNLRYQIILLTDPFSSDKTPWRLLDIWGRNTTTIKPGLYHNAWVLVNSKNISNYTEEFYSDSDLKVILSFIAALCQDSSLEVVELLCQSTKIKDVIDKFYSSYGREGMISFKTYITTLLKTETELPKDDSSKKYAVSYKPYRYSVLKLMEDLVEDKAFILLDPELVGDYENITDYQSNSTGLVKEEWCNIIGLVGNQEKANVSLRYLTKTEIEIPDNDFGIVPGNTIFNTIKTLCLINNGKLNHSKFGIRISDKLARKLKQLKIIKLDLVYKNDYLIDISELPIISKDLLRGCSSLYLARLEVKKLYAKTVLEYINYISPESLEYTEKEKFLSGLGIYNDTYYPPRDYVKSSTTGDAKNFVSIIKYYPFNSTLRRRQFSEYRTTGTCGNDNIRSFLRSIDFTQPLSDLKKYWSDQYNKHVEELRERKFQLIMLKSGKFNDGVYIDFVTKKVELTEGSSFEVSWKFK